MRFLSVRFESDLTFVVGRPDLEMHYQLGATDSGQNWKMSFS